MIVVMSSELGNGGDRGVCRPLPGMHSHLAEHSLFTWTSSAYWRPASYSGWKCNTNSLFFPCASSKNWQKDAQFHWSWQNPEDYTSQRERLNPPVPQPSWQRYWCSPTWYCKHVCCALFRGRRQVWCLSFGGDRTPFSEQVKEGKAGISLTLH